MVGFFTRMKSTDFWAVHRILCQWHVPLHEEAADCEDGPVLAVHGVDEDGVAFIQRFADGVDDVQHDSRIVWLD